MIRLDYWKTNVYLGAFSIVLCLTNALIKKESNANWPYSRGCSTAVEHLPHNRDVMGSCRVLGLFLISFYPLSPQTGLCVNVYASLLCSRQNKPN